MKNGKNSCDARIGSRDAASAPRWFAVHVRSNFELTVYRSLQHKGYEAFLPMYSETRRWSDRTKQMDVPLFAGYVFCRIGERDRLPLVTTPGVVQLVGQGKRPTPITDNEINSIKAVMQSTLPYVPCPSFAPGTAVVVENGPLMGVQGVLVESREERRLVISIDILNRAVSVEIDAEWVRPLGPLSAAGA